MAAEDSLVFVQMGSVASYFALVAIKCCSFINSRCFAKAIKSNWYP